MASRLQLHDELVRKLGTKNVYHQPPETIKMEYTAIVYSKSKMEHKNADDIKYLKMTRYELVVIAKRPDDPVIDKLLELPYCTYDRSYKSDNLNHDVLILYY